MNPHLVAFATLAIMAASPAVAGDKLEPGKPGNFETNACPRIVDMLDIANYAEHHAGDSVAEYKLKEASGICWTFDLTKVGPDAAVIDQVMGKFTDKTIGDVFIVKFHVTSGAEKTFLYGIIGTDQLALINV